MIRFRSVVCFLGALGSATSCAQAQQVNITAAATIQQQEVIEGSVPLKRVLESGAHFFSYPYFPTDGWGEGANGPRAWQRKALYPNSPFSPYQTSSGDVPPPIPFLRLNGIDSQSCFECHTSIGASVLADLLQQNPPAPATRTQPAIGGSAGIANNAFINPSFPNPLTQLIRNPPHVFGTGYSQALAAEMTGELLAYRQHLEQLAQYHPGEQQRLPLASKGQSFGTLGVTYQNSQFVSDYSGLTGVASDLVVRPFQWKGISSSVRHFVASATQFHFSMEGVEVVGQDFDNDGDGVINELSYGNVGALSTFVALTRPPFVEKPTDDPDRQNAAALGAAIFDGSATNAGIPPGSKMCATCHAPSLSLNRPVVTIEWGVVVGDPTKVGSDAGRSTPSRVPPQREGASGVRTVPNPSLVHPLPSADYLAVVRDARARLRRVAPEVDKAIRGKAAEAEIRSALTKAVADPSVTVVGGLDINLNTLMSRVSGSAAWKNLGGGATPDAPNALPAYTRDRLPFTDPDGPLPVPLLSDLRLHDMGPCLTDTASQPADVAGIEIPPSQFLTRPLWGVADSWPYLHDGRALDLETAIRYHGGTRPASLSAAFPYVCSGSEADPVIDAFYALSKKDHDALLTYLGTLRLPLLPGSVVPF